MAGILAKFARGASASGAQSMNKKAEDDVLALRDAKLRQYQVEDTAANQKFTADQNAISREDSRAQNAQQVALQAGSQAIANENLELNRQQTAAQIKQIDLAIANATTEAEERKMLLAERNRVAAMVADPKAKPADVTKALTELSVKLGTYKPADPVKYENVSRTTTDELGVRTQQLGSFDPSTGKYDMEGENSELNVDELMADFLEDPSEDNQKAVDELVGPGTAKKWLESNKPAAPASPAAPRSGVIGKLMGNTATTEQQPEPAPTTGIAAKLPPGGGVTRNNESPANAQPAVVEDDVLAGFKVDEGPKLGERAIASLASSISKAASTVAENRKERVAPAEAKLDQAAAKEVKDIIASLDLTPLRTSLAKGTLRRAIESGLLSPDDMVIITAWQQRKK